jgi:hypothetical protein
MSPSGVWWKEPYTWEGRGEGEGTEVGWAGGRKGGREEERKGGRKGGMRKGKRGCISRSACAGRRRGRIKCLSLSVPLLSSPSLSHSLTHSLSLTVEYSPCDTNNLKALVYQCTTATVPVHREATLEIQGRTPFGGVGEEECALVHASLGLEGRCLP